MVNTQRNIASFLVRFTQDLWQDGDGEPRVQWRGRISHVQGDEETPFTDFAEVVAFIQRHLTQLTLDTLAGGPQMDQEKTLRESFKLWEQFASSYSDLMFEAMERTIKQSTALHDQMEEAARQAVQAWPRPAPSDRQQTAEELSALQAQVKALAEKVEALEQAVRQQAP